MYEFDNLGISNPTDLLYGDISTTSGFDFSGAAMGLMGISIAGKAFGDYMKGQQQSQAYEYNAELVRQEEQIALMQIGKEEVALLSTQRAAYARAGVTQSGSPLDVALGTATEFELDKQITRYNAESKARMLEWEAKKAKQAGTFSAGMDLLQGAASMALILA